MVIRCKKYIPVAVICMMSFLHSYAGNDVRSLFDQGMEAFKTGNYGSAELLLRKIVDSRDGEYIDRAWFYLARSIFHKKKFESALFEFKSFLNKCRTDSLATESRYWMGECYFNLSDYSNAIEEFRRYISRSKDGELVSAAHDRIGALYLSEKRYDEAVLEWEAAISAGGNTHDNTLRQYRIGDALFRNAKYDEAIQKLVPLMTAQTDIRTGALAELILGRIYQEQDNHQKALQMFNAIPGNLLKEDDFRDAQYFKAKSYARLGNIVQAKYLLDAFLAAGKNSEWYYNGLYNYGEILLKGEGRDEGLKILERVRSEADSALRLNASVLLGQFYAERSPEKAIPYLEESVASVRPEERNRILVLLGRTHFLAKKYDKAVEVYSLYLKENPLATGIDEVEFMRARAYLEMGEIQRAIDIFDSIKKENPFSKFNSESNYYLALIHYKKGDTAAAIGMLREYLTHKNAENAYDANLLLLQVYLSRNDLDNAGKIADVLIRNHIKDKNVETALYEYATALMRKGLDARRYINIILNRFPGSETAAELCFTLGNENFNRKKYEYALEYYNKYLISPYTVNRGSAFYKKILTLYNLRWYDDVITLATKGDVPPMDESQIEEISLLLARSYYSQKKLKEAYLTLDIKRIGDYPKDDILMYIRSALSVGDYRSAMEANEFLENDKQVFAESLYLIGEFILRSENPEEAELYFSKIINECPGTSFVNRAKLSLSEMHIMNKKYQDAVNLLGEVTDDAGNDLRNRKNSLLIQCFFEMGMADKAVSSTEDHLSELLSSEHGESVMKHMLEYYHKKNDLQQFERYAQYLGKYTGNEPLIYHLSGTIYLQSGNFYKSYNYFYALSRMKSRYTDEALYYLGVYSLQVARNLSNAITYFSQLLALEEGNAAMKLKAQIELAIIYREMNNNDKAWNCLQQVLSATQRGLYYIQAGNLHEEFGYGSHGGGRR
ncbi:MAG: hypothetical protein A2176_00650 [Spirochaetes bacterium RBG_13_51_14]|nr:MAG: hypothetical protein A2176_00650 [Spirochaetes bacterium RBG_13_51_14]